MSNPQLENGYIRIANEIWDALTRYRLSGEEVKCLMFIIRMTYGWQKKKNTIKLSQFVQATDMAKSSVCRAIKKLTAKNIIIVYQTVNGNSPTYQFNKKSASWNRLPNGKSFTKRSTGVYQIVNGRLPNGKSHLIKTLNKDININTHARAWPDDFCLTENMRHFAIDKGIAKNLVDAFFDDFRDWAKAKGAKYKDWQAAFRMRVNKAPEYGKQFCKPIDPWENL